MEKPQCPKLHFKNDTGLPNTICKEATFIDAEPGLAGAIQILHSSITRDEQGNTEVKRSSSFRKGADKSKFFVNPISSPKKRWHHQAYIQPQGSQSICDNRKISVDKHAQHSKLFTTERLACEGRHITGIFPSTYTNETQMLSSTGVRRRITTDDVSSIWLKFGTQSFCQFDKLDSTSPSRKGVRLIVYLDDFLVAHQNKQTLVSHVNIVLQLLEKLGWQINYQKSIITPQRRLEYLGILWDTWQNEKSLPTKKVTKILGMVNTMLHQGQSNLKNLEVLVGMLNFASFVIPRGRLNFRSLQRMLNWVRAKNPTFRFCLPSEVIQELRWWLSNAHQSSSIQMPTPTHFLTTDASDIAWGAKLNNTNLSGPWAKSERSLHGNQKELLTVLKVLEQSPQLGLLHSSLLLQSDSRTVVAYLRNEGGTRSVTLMDLTFQIYQYYSTNFRSISGFTTCQEHTIAKRITYQD